MAQATAGRGPARGERRLPADIGVTRRNARERALSILYEADVKHQPVDIVVAELPVAPDSYAVALSTGVDRRRSEIDKLLAQAAVGWEVERMPMLDRAVLRMAVLELLEQPDVPLAVVLDEAVELAKRFSTDQSGGFVNGVLATIARQVRPDA